MTILQGDIQLRASQVMLDVDEGGGAPTATQIIDGQSNGIFADVSEVDRAGGNLSARKVFVKVLTDNIDSYLGANVIVETPPADPRVSVTIFSTGETFDQRTDAMDRIEAYLYVGPALSFYLLGDHIEGQMTLTLLGQLSAVPPVVGDSLVLRKLPGTSNEHQQYLRVTSVATLTRTFTDGNGDFQRQQVTLQLSDALDADYPGFDPVRADTTLSYSTKSKAYGTIVADAARYYGASGLTEAGSIGDYSVVVSSIYASLVPSAQVETAIADARINQQVEALVAAGGQLAMSLTATFSTAANLYIGGSITPGSLTIVRGGTTLTDKGSLLINAATTAVVGAVDYANGILSLTTSVFGTSGGTHAITYTPAAVPEIVSQSASWEVTATSQRLTYVATLDPVPAKGTLQAAYMVQGRWYVLSDDGSGALRGGDSSVGVGNINVATGTVSLTLGALPDVGSEVILSWAPVVQAAALSTLPTTTSDLNTRAFFAFSLGAPIAPGALSLSWPDGGTERTATDDGGGGFSGYAVGEIEYSSGVFRFSPTTLPPAGGTLTVTLTPAVDLSGSISSFSDGGSSWSFSLPSGLRAYGVSVAVAGQRALRTYPGVDVMTPLALKVTDDGAGHLQLATPSGNLTVGTVNYSTGACTLSKSVAGWQEVQDAWDDRTPFGTTGTDPSYIVYTGTETRTLTLTLLNGPASALTPPEWAWWSGNLSVAAQYQAAGSDGTGTTATATLDTLYVRSGPSNWYIGADHYSQGSNYGSSSVYRNIDASTGVGTAAGSLYPSTYNALVGAASLPISGLSRGSGYAALTLWTSGYSPVILNAAGAVQPSTAAGSTQLIDGVVLRTAVSPLRAGAFQIVGTWSDGTTFTATADSAGVIKSGSTPVGTAGTGTRGVFGTVNYSTGIARLRFGSWVGSDHAADSGVTDVSYLGIGVQYLLSHGALSDSLRYNASAYTYLPLDPDIIGVNPVRLPSDGRVPIFRAGSYAVVGHKATVGPVAVSAGQVINCGRTRLSRARVVGNDGVVIATGYTVDLDAGLVTVVDPTGWSQPVTVEHKIEDMALIRDAQINGQLSFTRPLTHDFPLGSYVSSALVAGNLQARVSVLFDQGSWTTPWADVPSGSDATATFNAIDHPVAVTNAGAVTERWACRFTNTNAFDVYGEHLGLVASGNTSTDCAPINAATGLPYFTIPAAGWGGGWAVGNVMRFNTIGAEVPVWVIRTVQQGPATADADKFTLLVRGDVDNP